MPGFKYHVFLSHSTPEKPAVEELAVRLRREGIEPWLDKWNLVPGELCQVVMETALTDCADLRRVCRPQRFRRLAGRGDAGCHCPAGERGQDCP